ncbi:MAG: RNA-guided endonuclease TnpB family protein, partial [Thermosynechococcus sp.]|uniref:RNA-guided endonuclease TnpB family protein n=1 Tax=Thermosynechococcus sp. TaxID=2814275 RepID=UPI003919AE2D
LKLVRSKKGIWYACLSVSMEVPDAKNTGRWIGIDRGQNIPVVAATPDGPIVFWKAARIQHVRRMYAERRRKLQKLGKHRAVRKLESKERRIVTHINHCISKELVAMAKRQGAGLILEDLSGIRQSSRQRKDAKSDAGQNRDYWPFYQLEIFIRYKAMEAGVKVEAVRPHYTSKTCHVCGALNERKKHAYVCTRCGHQAHADANAAMNIRDWHGLCCPLELEVPVGGLHEPALNPVRETTAQAVA